jgi:hypothetical protein
MDRLQYALLLVWIFYHYGYYSIRSIIMDFLPLWILFNKLYYGWNLWNNLHLIKAEVPPLIVVISYIQFRGATDTIRSLLQLHFVYCNYV